MNRSLDWLKQAERDLEFARENIDDGYFEWISFIAQQAAEKAVKSLFYKLNMEPWGHSISRLLEEVKEKVDVPDDIIECSKYLDKLYIPTRYPNGFSEGYPGKYYTEDEARKAIDYAEKIIVFVKKFVRE